MGNFNKSTVFNQIHQIQSARLPLFSKWDFSEAYNKTKISGEGITDERELQLITPKNTFQILCLNTEQEEGTLLSKKQLRKIGLANTYLSSSNKLSVVCLLNHILWTTLIIQGHGDRNTLTPTRRY